MTNTLDETRFIRRDETGIEKHLPSVFSSDNDTQTAGVSLLADALRSADTGWWYWNLKADRVHWPHDLFPLPDSVTGPFDYQAFLSFVHPEDRGLVDENWKAVIEGRGHKIEYRLTTDRETKWIAQTVRVETDDDGAPHRAIGVLRDVTAQKRRTRELESFREVIEHAGHSIYWTDPDGTIRYVNPAFEATTGYSFDEAVGNTPSILKSGEHDEAFYRELWRTITGGDVWSREIVNERKDGDQYVVDQTIAPVETDDGDIAGFVAVNTDITDRKREQRELEILREAIDKAHLSITLIDPDQEGNPIVYANDAFEELTGYTASEVTGQNCWFLQGEKTKGERITALQEAIRNEEQLSIELRNYRKDGAMFWNKVTVTPIYDDEGDLVRILGTQEDVTRRREHEQRLKVLNRVLRHNLRNKLSIIIGYATALEKKLAPEELSQSARRSEFDTRIEAQFDCIIEHATELAALGDKVRRFQHVIDEIDRTESVEVSPVLDSVRSDCLAEHPDVSIEIGGEYEVSIRTNRKAFKLAMSELLENAIVHGRSGQPLVTITVEQERSDSVTLHIADSGPGIPEMEREVLTEGNETPLLHGSGFGLWMVNWLVLRFGGSVSIEETGSTGTVVSVTFPSAND